MNTTPKKILRDIKLSELLGTELNNMAKKVKYHIYDKLEGLVQFEMEKYPNSIYYKKDEKVLFIQDSRNEYLWCSFEHYWSEIGLSYEDIQELTQSLVGVHLNCKQFKPIYYFKNHADLVGVHLNCKQFKTSLKPLT